jgi:hypothetical protein
MTMNLKIACNDTEHRQLLKLSSVKSHWLFILRHPPRLAARSQEAQAALPAPTLPHEAPHSEPRLPPPQLSSASAAASGSLLWRICSGRCSLASSSLLSLHHRRSHALPLRTCPPPRSALCTPLALDWRQVVGQDRLRHGSRAGAILPTLPTTWVDLSYSSPRCKLAGASSERGSLTTTSREEGTGRHCASSSF